jgi:hypothetical protein
VVVLVHLLPLLVFITIAEQAGCGGHAHMLFGTLITNAPPRHLCLALTAAPKRGSRDNSVKHELMCRALLCSVCLQLLQ